MANRDVYQGAQRNQLWSMAKGLSGQYDVPLDEVLRDMHLNLAMLRDQSYTPPVAASTDDDERMQFSPRAQDPLTEEVKAALIKLGLPPELSDIRSESELKALRRSQGRG